MGRMNGIETVLVLEEDSELRAMYGDALRSAGCKAVSYGDSPSAAALLGNANANRVPSLVVINSRSGTAEVSAVLSAIAGRGSASNGIPVLILADGIDSGFFQAWRGAGVRSEILVRPFTYAAFVSKVQALFPETAGPLTAIPGLSLNPSSYDVHLNGERLHLTGSEYRLLAEFLAHPGVSLSRDELVRKVLGEGIVVVDRAIDTHVFSLRKKLGTAGSLIETVRGEGYRLCRSGVLASRDPNQE